MFTEPVALELNLLHPPLFQGNAEAAEGMALPRTPSSTAPDPTRNLLFWPGLRLLGSSEFKAAPK